MDLCSRISFRFEIQLRTGEWGWIETMNKRLAALDDGGGWKINATWSIRSAWSCWSALMSDLSFITNPNDGQLRKQEKTIWPAWSPCSPWSPWSPWSSCPAWSNIQNYIWWQGQSESHIAFWSASLSSFTMKNWHLDIRFEIYVGHLVKLFILSAKVWCCGVDHFDDILDLSLKLFLVNLGPDLLFFCIIWCICICICICSVFVYLFLYSVEVDIDNGDGWKAALVTWSDRVGGWSPTSAANNTTWQLLETT